MKNLVAITFFLALALMANGQTTVINETLRGGSLPTNWSQTDVTFSTSAGGYANFTSNTAVLETDVFDLSSYSSATIEFDVAKFGSGGDGPITCEVSNDGGSSWTQSFNSPTPTSSTYLTSGPTSITISLTNQMKLRFTRASSPSQKRLRDLEVVASGSGCTQPTNQASSASSSSVTSNSATISWTKGSGSDGSIVVLNAGSAVSNNPVSGSSYSASADWSSKGTALGTSADYVVFLNTSGTGVNLTNLDPATTYHYAIYDYMSSGTCFNITSPATGSFTTNCSTPDNVTGASTNPSNQQVEVSWTNGACFDEILVFADETNGLGTNPSGDGTSYTANTVYTSAGQCVYKGSGSSVTVTGLTNSTTYYFEIYARKGTIWSSGVEVNGIPQAKGLNVTALSTPVLIDFDNTLSGVNNGQFNGSGFSPTPSSGQLNSESWSIDGLSDGTLDFDGTATSGDFSNGSSTGGASAGGIYAFEVASSDYALGVQPTSGDFSPGTITLKTNNNTGSTVSHILVEYDVFIYNDEGRANDFDFSHSADNSTYILLNNADITSVENAAGSPGWERYSRKVLIALPASLTNGSQYYLRWSSDDVSGSGSRDEFALDNIRITMYSSAPSSMPNTITASPQASLVIDGIDAELGGNVTVDQLQLNDATLSLGNNTLTVNNSISGVSSTAYIITNGSGSLRKSFSSTGSFDYPIGTSNGYSPVTLDFTSGTFSSAWAEARVVASKHPSNTSSTDFINRYWVLGQSGITGFECDITCTYLDGDVNGTEADIVSGKFSSGSWTAGNAVNTTNNTMTFDNATSFSDISGGEPSALPVSWLEFKGKVLPHTNLLQWSTAQEINNSHFMIERSGPEGVFRVIGRVEGHGNVQGITHYQFEDLSPLDDAIYRLRQVDFDGSTDFSRNLRIKRKEDELPKGLSVYPNPAKHSIRLQGLDAEISQELRLYNNLGQQLRSWKDVQNEQELELSELPQGMFWLDLLSNGAILERKLLMIKY